MTAWNETIESQIRDLGQSLKLQLDFTAAADMNKTEDRMKLAQNNNGVAGKMIGLMQALSIPFAGDDAAILEKIADVAEQNGSDAGKLLKQQAPKVRSINTEVASIMAQKRTVTPDDLNRVFRKHLGPRP